MHLPTIRRALRVYLREALPADERHRVKLLYREVVERIHYDAIATDARPTKILKLHADSPRFREAWHEPPYSSARSSRTGT